VEIQQALSMTISVAATHLRGPAMLEAVSAHWVFQMEAAKALDITTRQLKTKY
jgi:hypothetical protein